MTKRAVYLVSKLLADHGFAHGFSLRTGGVSPSPYESLNLGRAVGDDPASVAENHERFGRAIGVEPRRLFEVSQVHGAQVVLVEGSDEVSAIRQRKADALIAVQPGMSVGIRTADCLPLLIADPATGAVAAVHAGWRGVVAGVVKATLAALGQRAIPTERCVAAIGPHIRVASFEVGSDVGEQIAASAPGESVLAPGSGASPHADLAAAVRWQLTQCGVERIDDIGGDTYAEPNRFFSHRRDAGRTGRHLAAIAARA